MPKRDVWRLAVKFTPIACQPLRIACACFIGLLVPSCTLRAQNDAAPLTLHAYVNVIEVPVLVLNDSKKPIPPIDAQRFNLSLNSGRSFRPTHVRFEGDDAINLSIVIDARSVRSLLPRLPDAIASLVPTALQPRDHVTLYSFNCKLMHYAGKPIQDAALLKEGTEAVIRVSQEKPLPRCANRAHLWDALDAVTNYAVSLPGRAVVLVVTDGLDDGSTIRWPQLAEAAGRRSVALFGLIEDGTFISRDPREDLLTVVCELSGGMVLRTETRKLSDTLIYFVSLLRGRYIISFPRPDTLQLGPPIDLRVSITRQHAFIRPAGIEVPLPDPKVLADPNTLRSDPDHAPEVGKRRVLTVPQ